MKNTLPRFCTGLLFLFLMKTSYAQLVVGNVATAEELAQSLVGSGVTISNITLNCPNGGWGSFDGTNSNVGLDQGIILACGDKTNAPGPNNTQGITTDFQTLGDQDLTNLANQETYDACVLEFDLQTTGDTVKFNYVFGSEEYSEFVGSYNDIFAFLISGPGIVGLQNIALVPGTGTPVSINNVNCQNGSPYYICNDPTNYICPGNFNCPTDINSTTVQYDGITVSLTAIAAVQPCETYHLKLAIADAGDHVLDSGVFLQAGSLTSSGTSVFVETGYVDPNTSAPAIVEGCIDGSFNFVVSNPPTDTVYIHYTVGGTATNGIDYTQIPDSLAIYPGDTTASIIVHSFNDVIPEGSETITLFLYLPCSQVPYDSATIIVLDTLIAVAEHDTTICVGQTVQLSGNGADSWMWNPGSGLNCTTCQNPLATPTVTTTYTLTINVGGCFASDVVTIHVDNPLPVSAGPDLSICLGDSIQLTAINAGSYSWNPSTGLSCNNCSNPFASPSSTTTYIVTGTNGCFTTSDTVKVTVNPGVNATAFGDTTICPGDTVPLFAFGGVTYSWSPESGLSDPDIQNPLATTNSTVEYTARVTNQFGCSDTASVLINVYDIPEVTITPYPDTTIYLGNSVGIDVQGGIGYSWAPPTYLDDPTSSNPISVLPGDTITYYVTVTSAEGCETIDSVTINVRWDALVELPSAFSPNSDGKNDLLHVLARGIFSLDHFYIYNRWGQLVFQTNDVNMGWDGKYKGEDQIIGVFVYDVQGKDYVGNSIQRKGNVTLVR